MKNKIEVCGVMLDNLTVGEMMQALEESFGNGRLYSVQYIYSDLLRNAIEDEAVKEVVESADMTVIGEPAVAEVFDSCALTVDEIANYEFTKAMLRFLEQQGKTVYWLGESEQAYEVFRAYLDKHYAGLQTVGAFVTDLRESGTEEIVNDINRVTPDVIFSRLSSPYQEQFFALSRPLMNAQVWFAMGSKMNISSQNATASSKIKAMIDKTILKRLAANQKKSEDDPV